MASCGQGSSTSVRQGMRNQGSSQSLFYRREDVGEGMEGSRASVGDSHNNFVPQSEAGVANILPERWVSLQGFCVFWPTQSVTWGPLGAGEPASLTIFFPREVALHCQPQEACGHPVHWPSRPVC